MIGVFVGFSCTFLLGILIFKGLTVRRLYKSFGIKGLLSYKGREGSDKKMRKRRKKLVDDLKDRRGYSHLKEEALDCTMWRNCFRKMLWTCH
jgi:hypothetical protein